MIGQAFCKPPLYEPIDDLRHEALIREQAILDQSNDPVNHPSHYTSHPARCVCGNKIECIQITEHMSLCLGNAMKYIWRAGLKDKAKTIEDLQKAQFYIAREIKRLSN